jgi:hypothetical protein
MTRHPELLDLPPGSAQNHTTLESHDTTSNAAPIDMKRREVNLK